MIVLSRPTNTDPTRSIKLRLLFIFVVLLMLAVDVSTARAQQMTGREIAFPRKIQWDRQKGVTRYRLQIAGDELFENVFMDGPVAGEHYLVTGLSAGYYYWRVAPINSRSAFSQPMRFFISGGVITTVRLPSRAIAARSSALMNSKVP